MKSSYRLCNDPQADPEFAAARSHRPIPTCNGTAATRILHRHRGNRRIRKWSIVEPVMTRSLVVAPSTQRPVTKGARTLVVCVRKQVDTLVAEGLWAPRT